MISSNKRFRNAQGYIEFELNDRSTKQKAVADAESTSHGGLTSKTPKIC